MNSPVFLEQRTPHLSPCPYRQFGSHRWGLPTQAGGAPGRDWSLKPSPLTQGLIHGCSVRGGI